MDDIEFVKPSRGLIEDIARTMRQSDVDEIWAASNKTPIEALTEGLTHSDYSAIAMHDDEPLIMFGLVKRDLISGTGIVWMLGSDNALKYRKGFLTKAPLFIDEMLSICPRLMNMVHSENTESIRWLKWLGFTIEPPVRHGVENEFFHKFYIERF